MSENFEKAYIYSHNKIYIGCADVLRGVFGEKEAVLRITDEVMDRMTTSFLLTFTSDSHGLVTDEVEMAEFKQDDRDSAVYIVKCNLVKTIEVIQRRENFKVKVTIPVTISLVEREAIDDNIKSHAPKAQYPVVIKDISAGGVLFLTREELEVGQTVEFTFDRTNQPFNVNAEVLRVQDMDDGYKGYGCCFINLQAAKESSIRRFIFSLQLNRP